MSDIGDRIRDDENAFQQLAGAIPGFKGYRENEIRRTADRLVRDHLVKMLDEIRAKLEKAMRASGTTKLQMTSQLGALQRRMTALCDRVDHAGSGYTGFFDAIKIGEEELDRMYEFDVSLKKNIGDMDVTVDKIIAAGEDCQASLEKLEGQMDEFRQLLDSRDDVVRNISID